MRLRLLLTAAVVTASLGCGEPAPPPVPRGATRAASPSASAVSTSAALPQQQQPQTPAATVATAPPATFGPFSIDGKRYSAIATRFTNRSEGDSVTGTSGVEVRDSLQRVVYSARVMSDTDIANGSWNDFSVSWLEDASGRSRALIMWTSSYPSAPGTGESFSVVAPRGDSLRRLFTFDWFGNTFTMGADATKKGARLLARDQLVAPSWMFYYEARVAVHVSLDCEAGSGRCLDIALPDSISGLARYPVEVMSPRATDTAATVQLFDAPLATHGTQVVVPKGVIVEVLGGAGKVSLESDHEVQRVEIKSDWLLVRVNGHTGWITGDEAYRAIGLQEAG